MLYDHQKHVKSMTYNSINKGNRFVMIKAPTGFGKTHLAISIVKDAVNKNIKVIFTAPMITLIEQTYDSFSKAGIQCGIIQADHPLTDYSLPVQVASIQTLAKMLKKNPIAFAEYFKEALIIHDEAHLRFKTHSDINEATTKPVIGLSATPWSKGLGKTYKDMINAPDVGWHIQNEYLSDFVAFSHYTPDLKGVKTSAGDYSLKETGEKYTPKIVASLVATWKEKANGLQTILFAPRVVDAERFAKEFVNAGVKAVAVSGYMDSDDCQDEIDKFRNHETTIICSVAKLAVGFDVPDIGCIIDAQPTKSLMRHVQKLGRGLRVHEGKDKLIILDHAGNLLRNGLPDGSFPTTLDDGEQRGSTDRKRKSDPLPTCCSKCKAIKPPKVHECPSCGFKPEKQSTLEVEAGRLVEIEKTKARVSATRNKTDSPEDKIRLYARLKYIAKINNYNPHWADHRYKTIYGVWPNKYKNAPAIAANEINTNTQS